MQQPAVKLFEQINLHFHLFIVPLHAVCVQRKYYKMNMNLYKYMDITGAITNLLYRSRF